MTASIPTPATARRPAPRVLMGGVPLGEWLSRPPRGPARVTRVVRA